MHLLLIRHGIKIHILWNIKNSTLENEIEERKNETSKEPLGNNANIYRNLKFIPRQQSNFNLIQLDY